MSWRRLASVPLLVAMFVASCGSSSESPSAPPTTGSEAPETVSAPAPVDGLVATIGTNRLYALDRAFGLGLQNVGSEPVVVRELRLDSSLFTNAPAAAREVVLAPGSRRLVLPLPYGEARCGANGSTFAAVLVVDDGEELRVPAVEEYPGAIGRLHGRECAAADVHERVDIHFGDRWTRDGVAISGELLLDQRHPGAPVAIDDAVGNVIFTLLFEGDDRPIVGVSDDEPTARVPVTISADRCDPHALAEVKRPFVFLSWVTVGDAPSVPVELEPTGAARAELEELFATC